MIYTLGSSLVDFSDCFDQSSLSSSLIDCCYSSYNLAAFVSFTKILFFADLMLANLYTSNYCEIKSFSYIRAGHGRSDINIL